MSRTCINRGFFNFQQCLNAPNLSISRVENGHTVPAIETLEKMARALEVPLYQLFYDGEEPPKLPNLLKGKSSDENVWGVRARMRGI